MDKVIFYGEYEHSLDEKGRVILPAKFRELLGDHCHITRGYDNCLSIYDDKGWEECLEKMMKNLEHETNGHHRRLNRNLSSGGVDINIDKQGRMLIPPLLREYAGIDKEVSIIGSVNKVEIWDKEAWRKYINDEENTMVTSAEEVEKANNGY